MSKQENPQSEVVRLEKLWSGEFGNDYTQRNNEAARGRDRFWKSLLKEVSVSSVLEVGCNLGGNLQWIAEQVPPRQVFGIDINEKALMTLRKNVPGVNANWASAKDLPFRDRWFDLTFTMGVLIHQSNENVSLVMSEVVRCSKKYVLCGEYFAEQTTEVPYRGHAGALFKRNYGALYQQLFPDLKLLKKGFLGKDEGWDDITYWLFEKP